MSTAKKPTTTTVQPFARAFKDGRTAHYDSGIKGVGNRIVKRHKSKAIADAYVLQLIAEQERGALLKVGPGATWADLCQAWVTANDVEGAVEGTVRKRISDINCWIVPHVGHILVRDTRLSTLVSVLDALLDSPGGRAVSTLDGLAQSMDVVATWGADRDWMIEDFFGSDMRRQRTMKTLRAKCNASGRQRAQNDGDADRGIGLDDVPTWESVCELADAVADRAGALCKSLEKGKLYGAAVRVYAGTGGRMCELLGSTTEAVLESGELDIFQQLNRYVKWVPGEPMPVVPPKRKKRRQAKIWAKVRPDLEVLVAAAVARGDGILIPPIPNNTWWADGWGRLLESARTEISWPFPPHYLRHHYGSYSITPREHGGLGRPPAEVQASMGHTKLSTTLDTYIHNPTRGAGWIE